MHALTLVTQSTPAARPSVAASSVTPCSSFCIPVEAQVHILSSRWLEAWRDLRELQGAGAFALLTKEAMLAELCRALLRGSHFSLAQSYLQVCLPARTRSHHRH